MNKEPYQYPTKQIYTKKRNIDSVISVRSVQSNKSSASTKTKSNISTTLNDASAITSFVFNLNNALLITNINNSITSALITSANLIDSHLAKTIDDNQLYNYQRMYIDSCIDSIDNKIQGTLCLSEINKQVQESLISLSHHRKESKQNLRSGLNTDEAIVNNGSEMKILRINKQALYSIRNNSNDIKPPSSAKKEKMKLISFVKGNSRFHSPPVSNSNTTLNEGKSSSNKKERDQTIKTHSHYSQITNITPVSIKIKVYNSNRSNNNSVNDKNKTIAKNNNKIGNGTLKSNTKRILALPKNAKEYVKSSSPKPSIPINMHKEMNETNAIKANPKKQSYGFQSKPLSRPESPNIKQNQLTVKQLQPHLYSQHESTLIQNYIHSLPYNQSQIKDEPGAVTVIEKQCKTKRKPPIYPKAIAKKSLPQPIAINPQRSKASKEGKLNLSCDDIYPESNARQTKSKLANSELNKSFEDYTVFDLNNDIFNIINNSCIIVQDESSVKHSQTNLRKEQEKRSLDLIRQTNETKEKLEDWERASANFHKEQQHDSFDRFSFHNKKVG